MPEAGLTELLQAGVHFGHQTRRWNPNMRRFIFGELDGIHIIDLLQTEALLENARRFAGELASGGGTVLFVGTKKQARDVGPGMGRPLQDALRQQALAGRAADQLQHDVDPDRPPARAQRLERGRQTRSAADQGADEHGGRTRQARVQPRRRPRHGPAARRGLRHRPQNRGDRGPRGGPPADPDHRPGRHQLRPDPGRLRDPRQRRRDPLLPAGHRHDRRRRRGGLQRLARPGGEAHRRGNGAAQKGRGRAQEARGGRESPARGRGGGESGRRGRGAGQSDRSGAGRGRRDSVAAGAETRHSGRGASRSRLRSQPRNRRPRRPKPPPRPSRPRPQSRRKPRAAGERARAHREAKRETSR